MSTKALLVALIYALMAAGAVGMIAYASMPRPRSIPVNDLAQLVEDGQIASH